jgi:hypothetical protein
VPDKFGKTVQVPRQLSLSIPLRRLRRLSGLESAPLLLGAYPLFQEHFHSFADFLSDRSAYLYLYRQHVPAVTHGHERTLEGMIVNCASDFNQAMCTEKLD